MIKSIRKLAIHRLLHHARLGTNSLHFVNTAYILISTYGKYY
jgi:hypothetical protein